MIICVPVTNDGQVGHGWGRAARVALAEAGGGQITAWREVDVRWNELHDQGPEGTHHARIVRFLRDNGVDTVVAGHMGGGMRHTLGKMGVRVLLGAAGDARAAVEAVGR